MIITMIKKQGKGEKSLHVCTAQNQTKSHLPRPERALQHVGVLPDPPVVLVEPLKRRLVGVELGLYVRVRQEPPLSPVHRLCEARSVEVEGHPGAGARQAERERRRVAGEGQRGLRVLLQQVGPLLDVVVAEEVESL